MTSKRRKVDLEELSTESVTRNQIDEKIFDLSDKEEYEEALVWEKWMNDLFHTKSIYFHVVLSHVAYSEDEIGRMEQSDDANLLFRVGYMRYRGTGGASPDMHKAYECFSKASDMSYPLAVFHLALLHDVAEDYANQDLAFSLAKKAVDLGCPDAAFYCAVWADDIKERAEYYAMGASWGEHDCHRELEQLLEDYPETLPCWGRWEPKRKVHLMTLDHVEKAMYESLLVFRARKETRLPIYVTNLILFYICTKGGWEYDL